MESFARQVARAAVVRILRQAGFDSAEDSVIERLSDLLQFRLSLFGNELAEDVRLIPCIYRYGMAGSQNKALRRARKPLRSKYS